MRATSRWPWLTLLACVAASGTAGAQTAQPDAIYPPTPQPASETEEKGASNWRLPPLRIAGSLAYDLRILSGGGPPSTSHLVSATFGTSTYLYQPWFATVSGSLGLSSSWSRTTSDPASSDAQVHDRIRSNEQFVTGSARLDLFPRSRFPAEVHYDRQDSRTDTGLNSSLDFRRQNFGFSQRYRPAGGNWNAIGRFEHNDQSGMGFKSSQDALSADFATRWKFNDLSLGASHSRARSESFDDESRFTSVVARHAYTPSPALSVNSTANLTRTEELGVASSDLRVLQASSVAYYHPDKSPLTLTASARGLVLRESITDNAVESIGASLGGSYELNPNVRVSASGGASFNHSGGNNSSTFSGTLAASYQGDSITWRELRYDWFGSASVGAGLAQTSESSSQTDQSLGLQLGHTVGRSWRLGRQSTVSLNASQTLGASYLRSSRDEDGAEDGADTTKTLLNTISATWQNNGDGRTAYARVSYSDSVEFGGSGARFQLFNFQLSGNFDLGYGRSVTGDLTYQRTRQRTSTLDAGAGLVGLRSGSQGASGEVNFRQDQLFGVRRLRFTSRLRLAQDVLKQPGQLLSFPDRETRLWENRLDWSIGRLETQVILRFSEVDGSRINSLWFRIQRNFGN